MFSRRNALAIVLGFAIGCGSNSNNNNNGDDDSGGADASMNGSGSGSNPGSGSGSGSGPGSGSDVGPACGSGSLPAGVYAIPLSTPSNADQGFFYTPSLTTEGSTFLLDLDTGSTDTGIAGSTCTTCTSEGISPEYKPGTGATKGGTVKITYADNSGWSGTVYTDTVTLGAGSPTFKADVVDMTKQTEFFSFSGSNEYQGILGVGRDDLAGSADKITYLDGLFGSGVTQEIAVEMSPTEGTFWLGGYDASHASSTVQYTPMLSTGDNAAFYSVDMTAMTLGSTDLGLTSALADGPILDTGTSLFYIPTAVEANLISAINSSAQFSTLFPSQVLTDPSGSGDTAGCIMAANGVSDAMVDSSLPPLNMTFGSLTITASALQSYLIDAGGGEFCMVMFGGGDSGAMTMGDMFLRGFVTVIDIANEQAGFAPSTHCTSGPAAFTQHEFHKPRELGRGPEGIKALKALRHRTR
jgi:hypothetical protein